jgi:hypothetical protein
VSSNVAIAQILCIAGKRKKICTSLKAEDMGLTVLIFGNVAGNPISATWAEMAALQASKQHGSTPVMAAST